MLKIAIIGGTSFIAKSFISLLGAQDIVVKVWSRNGPNYVDYPEKKLDVNELLEYDFIFNFMGGGIQPGADISKKKLYEINAFAPMDLLNDLSDKKFKGTVVTFGSYFEIGVQKSKVPTSEYDLITSKLSAINDYAISKRLLTRYIHDNLVLESFEVKVMHLILPNVFGAGENEDRLLPYLIRQIKLNNSIQLSNGLQTRQYLHVDNIVLFLKEIVLSNSVESGVFNLGSPHILTIKKLVSIVKKEAIDRHMDVPTIEIGKLSTRDMHAGYLALDDNLIKSKYGWKNDFDIQSAIGKYFSYGN